MDSPRGAGAGGGTAAMGAEGDVGGTEVGGRIGDNGDTGSTLGWGGEGEGGGDFACCAADCSLMRLMTFSES